MLGLFSKHCQVKTLEVLELHPFFKFARTYFNHDNVRNKGKELGQFRVITVGIMLRIFKPAHSYSWQCIAFIVQLSILVPMIDTINMYKGH